MFSCSTRLFALILIPFSLTGPAQAQTAPERQPGHLRLIDKLDRPEDGYCLDILGSGDDIRADLPMTVHNCKPGLYADEAVRLEPDGRLYFPAYRLCATVAGLNGRALAGAALVWVDAPHASVEARLRRMVGAQLDERAARTPGRVV